MNGLNQILQKLWQLFLAFRIIHLETKYLSKPLANFFFAINIKWRKLQNLGFLENSHPVALAAKGYCHFNASINLKAIKRQKKNRN